MSQLEMGAGSSKLKLGIAGAVLTVFGAAAYALTSSSATLPAKPAAAAMTIPQTPASEAAQPTPPEPAAAPTPMPSAAAAPAADSTSEAAAAAEAVAPSSASAANPQPLDETALNAPPAKDSAAAQTPAPAAKPRRVAHNQPVVPERPPAHAVLREWWKSDTNSPYAVNFVGQAAGSNALVVLFANPVSAAQASQRISVLDASGKAVATNWENGNNPRVLVQNQLSPGRYTVVVDSGSRVSGPVYIQ